MIEIVDVIYQPPCDHVEEFTAQLGEILGKIDKKKVCYLSGDYSINSLNNDKHIPTVYFLEYMSSNEYMQMINEPTRDAGGATTLIDNNSMNTVPNESTLIGLFYADISDHYPIFYIERGRAPCDVHFWEKRVYSD